MVMAEREMDDDVAGVDDVVVMAEGRMESTLIEHGWAHGGELSRAWARLGWCREDHDWAK